MDRNLRTSRPRSGTRPPRREEQDQIESIDLAILIDVQRAGIGVRRAGEAPEDLEPEAPSPDLHADRPGSPDSRASLGIRRLEGTPA